MLRGSRMGRLLYALLITLPELSCSGDSSGFLENHNLGQLSWSSVTNRVELDRSIKSGVDLISVSIDNGTEFLHLGGELHEFLPIAVNPTDPSKSSDLSLRYLMEQVAMKTGSKSGLHISFLTPGILPHALEVLKATLPKAGLPAPLLVEASVLSSDSRAAGALVNPQQFLNNITQLMGSVPVLGWSTYHGMDKVWRRLEDDKILLSFQEARLRQMIEQLSMSPSLIQNSDVKFLEAVLKKTEQAHPASFTALALAQLRSAIESNGQHVLEKNDPWVPRGPSKPPRSNPIKEILPDYYFRSPGYTKEQVDAMLAISAGLERVGFALRAGLVTGGDSVEQVARLVDTHPHRFLVVATKPTDKEGRADLAALVERVGETRIIFELEEREESGSSSRIAPPQEDRQNSAVSSVHSGLFGLVPLVQCLMAYQYYYPQ